MVQTLSPQSRTLSSDSPTLLNSLQLDQSSNYLNGKSKVSPVPTQWQSQFLIKDPIFIFVAIENILKASSCTKTPAKRQKVVGS